MKLKITFVFLLCSLLALPAFAKDRTKVIAHRGYWKSEGSAQNSLHALERANDIKVYGSEFDVRLTSDNIAIVHHDQDIQGKLISATPYAELKDLKLQNGETLPTLEQYLEKAKGLKHAKLIFELKDHGTPERDQETAKISVDLVNKAKLQKRTEYITFSLEAGKELIRLAPKAKVAYLNGELSPKQLKDLGFSGLDYHYKVMQDHPEWFKEAKELGLTVNVWTVNDMELLKELVAQGADFITTDLPVEAQKSITVVP